MPNPSILTPGTQVRIADGTPMPPVRFTRKLAEWERRNYDAAILHGGPDNYLVQRKPKRGWGNHYIVFLDYGIPASAITPTPDALLLPLKGGGEHATVDVAALPALVG